MSRLRPTKTFSGSETKFIAQKDDSIYAPARIFETMKPTSLLARTASVFAFLAALPAMAHAHPGHSALNWFSGAPHLGHESEYAAVLNVLAVLILAAGIYGLAARKR